MGRAAMLTKDALHQLAPRPKAGEKSATWDVYVNALVDHGGELCAEFGIDTALELQHFMAQVAHESGGFTILWESGAYSEAQIMRIFGVGKHSARVTAQEAREIAALPVRERGKVLFERVYGLGNAKKAAELGNTEPGDGFKFRGFGPMQITGRRDHERLLMGDHSPYAALRASFREWDEKNCNELAARDDIKSITRRINGGYNGIESRKRYLARAKAVWPKFPGADLPAVKPAEIVQVSSKAKAGAEIQAVGGAAVAVGAAAEGAEQLSQMGSQISALNIVTSGLAQFSGFLKAHFGLFLIAMGLYMMWRGRFIIRRVITDLVTGRYFPETKKTEGGP